MTPEPAAFIAQEFDFLLLLGRQRVEFGELLVQSKVRHYVTEIVAVQFRLKAAKICQHLRGRRNEIESRILRLDVIKQQIRMDNNSARDIAILLEQGAQIITFLVRKMLFPEKRIAEGQTRRDAKFFHEGSHLIGVCIAKSDTATTPQTIARRTIDRTDFTPLVKVFPMLAE